MAVVQSHCSKCKSTVELNIGQAFINYGVNWYASYKCKNCGDAIEIDWFNNKPDDEIVSAILEQDGKWELTLDGEFKKVSFMRALRSELNLPLHKVKKYKDKVSEFSFVGTEAEVAKFDFAFSRNGIKTIIQRIG